jgi:RNA polymerase sigma-70 factor, ECF subfamily
MGSGRLLETSTEPVGGLESKAMITEDREYIDRVLSGEASAFDVLVRKYNRMAGAIAFAIVRDFGAAEDIVQEAFLKAYQSLGTLRDIDKFKVWLAGIVRSRSLDWLRRRRSARSVPFSQAFLGDDDGQAEAGLEAPPAEELFLRTETQEKILDAIRSLAQEDRIVVTLKHMEGLSYKEIAELTSSTVPAVESRLFRARQELRKKLGDILK